MARGNGLADAALGISVTGTAALADLLNSVHGGAQPRHENGKGVSDKRNKQEKGRGRSKRRLGRADATSARGNQAAQVDKRLKRVETTLQEDSDKDGAGRREPKLCVASVLFLLCARGSVHVERKVNEQTSGRGQNLEEPINDKRLSGRVRGQDGISDANPPHEAGSNAGTGSLNGTENQTSKQTSSGHADMKNGHRPQDVTRNHVLLGAQAKHQVQGSARDNSDQHTGQDAVRLSSRARECENGEKDKERRGRQLPKERHNCDPGARVSVQGAQPVGKRARASIVFLIIVDAILATEHLSASVLVLALLDVGHFDKNLVQKLNK